MGGFIKDSSSNSYVLLGGGGHSELKTINGNSLFGSGDIVITSSSGSGAYLPLAGGTMTGTIIMNGASFEQTGKRWMYGSTRNSGFKYDYNGNEAFIISAGSYASAAISLYSGGRLALNDSNGQWNATVADMQIKLNCVGIGANVDTAYKLYVNGTIKSSGFYHSSVLSDNYVLLAGGGYKAISDFSGSGAGDVYWKDVKDKIRGGNEFNMVPSGYNNIMWFNYQSDANTTVTVSEYIFGNGSHSATAAIRSGTVYPGANASYNIGKTDSRWDLGYFNSGILIGSTSYTGEHTNAAGTTIKLGYIELSNTNAYIDFHRSGYYTSDYSSRLIHWNNRDRLYYECYSSTYSGYIATCEGNANNLVIIGVFDLYRSNDTTTTWSLSTICGPCSFTLQKSDSVSDVSFKSYTGSVQSWTISSNILRVYVNAPSSSTYAWKSTPYAVSCDARVMTRWINKQPVVTNCLHGEWVGSSIECLCTNIANGGSLYYYSDSPGRYIYITGSRPWGYDDGSNGLGMDMMRVTGNQSYQRIRFTVFGYIS